MTVMELAPGHSSLPVSIVGSGWPLFVLGGIWALGGAGLFVCWLLSRS
jgi:hypothetical protein